MQWCNKKLKVMEKFFKWDKKNDEGYVKCMVYKRGEWYEDDELIFETEFTDSYTANKLANEKLDELNGIVRPKKVVDKNYERPEVHPYHEWYDGSRFKYRNCLQ